MTKPWIGALGILLALMGAPAAASTQDVRPLAPIIEPLDPDERPRERDRDRAPGEEGPELVPLPEAASRAAAASRDRVRVAAILPASWSAVAEQYEPYWTGIASVDGFGLHGWSAYFATAALVPAVTPHPFLGPWGMLAYEGRLFENYRSVLGSPRAEGLLGEAAEWLQRGDHAMAVGRLPEAAHAYRRVTQSAPDFPLGYFGLGAALAALGDDEGAALAFRQAIDRYPGWLTPSLDWSLLYADPARMTDVRAEAERRASSGEVSSRFVAGVLHLYGGDPEQGRAHLEGLAGDRHAATLLGRAPR